MKPIPKKLVALASLALLCIVWFWTKSAMAYPWMIRHNYNACTPCHADPSGAGLLTEYGRAQSDILLRMHYGGKGEPEEPSESYGFMWGLVELPESVLLSAGWRSLYYSTKVGTAPAQQRWIQMQADLLGEVRFDRVRVNGSIGYVHEGARPAAITHSEKDNIVSRTHWIGLELNEEQTTLLRAGRMNLPFGIRNIEHTAWVDRSTRTSINSDQQHGVALSHAGERWRGELMAIAGNFQLNPDRFRERGYAGYAERSLSQRTAIGVSSLMTHARADTLIFRESLRGAHGLFARWNPVFPLVVLAEADLLIQKALEGSNQDLHWGHASLLQLDLELIQGLHFMSTAETWNRGASEGTSVGGWLSAVWFFLPHMEWRVDVQGQRLATPQGAVPARAALTQFHVNL